MFSITTTELSTSIPTPNARPDSEIIFSVTPLKYISTMANISEIGMLRAMITVGLRSRRNKDQNDNRQNGAVQEILQNELTIISI